MNSAIAIALAHRATERKNSDREPDERKVCVDERAKHTVRSEEDEPKNRGNRPAQVDEDMETNCAEEGFTQTQIRPRSNRANAQPQPTLPQGTSPNPLQQGEIE